MSRPSLIFQRSLIPYPGTDLWRAAVNYVTDGDTLWVERDTGCMQTQLIELRLTGLQWRGFNANERFTPGGKLVTAKALELAPPGTICLIQTSKDPEKYGRWLSPVLLRQTDGFTNPDIVIQGDSYISLAEELNRIYPTYAPWQTY